MFLLAGTLIGTSLAFSWDALGVGGVRYASMGKGQGTQPKEENPREPNPKMEGIHNLILKPL